MSNGQNNTIQSADKSNYKAIFFDLDGTLLPINMDEFLAHYYKKLREFCNQKNVDGDAVINAINLGVEAMMVDRDGRFNSERFWDVVEDALDENRDDIDEFLDEFYTTAYTKLGKDMVPNPAARQVLEMLSDKGYTLYLTTMPLFPLVGIVERLRWAGIDDYEIFDKITTFDNCHATKPDIAYFQENIDDSGLEPKDILVVGNNTEEDLSCIELGCDVYLILDYLINSNDFDVDSVKNGTLEQFFLWAKNLPSIVPSDMVNEI